MVNGYEPVPERDNAISLIRFVSMVFIVLCHFLQYYNIELAWWFNVGVQIFFVVSGFLFSSRKIDDPVGFITKQSLKILIPYWCFVTVVIALNLLFKTGSVTATSIIKLLTCSGTINGLQHLWFIPYIIFCYIITPYLYSIKKKLMNKSWFSITINMLCFFLFFAISQVLFNSFFRADRIICYIAGYLIAIYQEKFDRKEMKRLMIVSVCVALPINMIRIVINYIFRPQFSAATATLYSHIESYAHSFLGIMLFLVMYLDFKSVKIGIVLRLSDKYSYYVYLTHHIFIFGAFSMLSLTNSVILNSSITVLFIIISAKILHILVGYIKQLHKKTNRKVLGI